MADVSVDFTPYPSGKFPDCRQWPLEDWLTIRQPRDKGSPIVINGRAEYRSRMGGKDAPLYEQITWRQWYAWLANCPEDTPWVEMKQLMEERLSAMFPAPVKPEPTIQELAQSFSPVAASSCVPGPASSVPAAPRQEPKRYYEVAKIMVPAASLPRERDFYELYVTGGADGNQ